MSKWKPSEGTEDFLKAMKAAGMVPMCPQCGYECFCPALAQTLESQNAGTLILWCKDMGHWAGDVREAAWKHKSLLNVA
jgi:hypothetical protein